MDAAVKKLSILEMILSIKDEHLLDIIADKIKPLLAEKAAPAKSDESLKKYETKIEPALILSDVITEQNFKGIDKAKMKRLIKEADIQEPVDELLAMI